MWDALLFSNVLWHTTVLVRLKVAWGPRDKTWCLRVGVHLRERDAHGPSPAVLQAGMYLHFDVVLEVVVRGHRRALS